MVVSARHLVLAAALTFMALVAVGGMALSRSGAAKTIVVAVAQSSGPQAGAQSRHALLVAEHRPALLLDRR